MLSRIYIACLLAIGALTSVQAQTPPAVEATPQPDSDPKAWVAIQLDEAKKREASLNEKNLAEEFKKLGLPENLASDLLAASHDVVRNYQAAADVLTSLVNNQKILDDLKKQPDEIAKPKSDQEVDALRDKIESLRQQLQTTETQIRIDDAALTRARTAWEESQQQYRRTVEDTDAAPEGEAKTRATWFMQLAEIRQQAASSAVFLATKRIALDEVDQETKTILLNRLNRALKESGLDKIFSVQRANGALVKLTQMRDAVRPAIDEMRKTVTALNDTVSKLNQDLTVAKQANRTTEVAALAARLTVANEALNIATSIVVSQENWLSGLGHTEETWKRVRTAAEKPSLENYQSVRLQAEKLLAEMDPWRDQLPRNLQDAQRRLEEAEAQQPSKDGNLRKLEEARVDLLRRRTAQLREMSVQLANQYRTYEQMLTESQLEIASKNLSERALMVGKGLTGKLRNIWDLNLFDTKDETIENGKVIATQTRSVTLGKLLLAAAWLLLSLAVAKIISRTVSGRLGKRFSLEHARAEIIEKAFFFPLAVLLVLTTLNWLHIPLTAFAFMGGALAIGVGFGAQTLVNNFISGLILLSERRIKVGDTIEVDNHTGAVTNLGTRCSRILKGNGVEVLIPNSYLLEKNVVNWTLSNHRHNFDFAVSLSYGTPIEKALELLKKAVTEEGKVLKEPAPCISFEEFGTNALIFRIYYWVDLRGSDNRIIGTNIRMRIDRLCRENGIVIASPGQDMRLRTPEPITIRIEESRNQG